MVRDAALGDAKGNVSFVKQYETSCDGTWAWTRFEH